LTWLGELQPLSLLVALLPPIVWNNHVKKQIFDENSKLLINWIEMQKYAFIISNIIFSSSNSAFIIRIGITVLWCEGTKVIFRGSAPPFSTTFSAGSAPKLRFRTEIAVSPRCGSVHLCTG